MRNNNIWSLYSDIVTLYLSKPTRRKSVTSNEMKAANQRSKGQDRSATFKKVHRAIKGGVWGQSNFGKCITSPIQEGTAPEVNNDEIDFMGMM